MRAEGLGSLLKETGERGDAPTTPGAGGGCGLDWRGRLREEGDGADVRAWTGSG